MVEIRANPVRSSVLHLELRIFCLGIQISHFALSGGFFLAPECAGVHRLGIDRLVSTGMESVL